MPTAPKRDSERVRRNKPLTGWNATPDGGWQHGAVPEPPDGTTRDGRETWDLWFSAWWAYWWTPMDVPQIALALKLWETARSDPSAATKFQALGDALGLTPKGRYALRWLAPDDAEQEHAEKAPVRRLKVADTA